MKASSPSASPANTWDPAIALGAFFRPALASCQRQSTVRPPGGPAARPSTTAPPLDGRRHRLGADVPAQSRSRLACITVTNYRHVLPGMQEEAEKWLKTHLLGRCEAAGSSR